MFDIFRHRKAWWGMPEEPAEDAQENLFLHTPGVAARETLLFLDRNGIDAEPILARAGVSRSQLSHPGAGVTVVSQYRFLECAAAQAEDPLLGMHVALQMDLRSVGVPYYLVTSSTTIAHAFCNLARYSRVASEAILFELLPKDDMMALTIVPVRRYREPRPQYCEFVAMVVVRALRVVTNRGFTLSQVTFTHARNTALAEAAQLFGCSVAYADTEESVIFPRSAMQIAIVSRDAHLLEILIAHGDHLLAERRNAMGLRNVVERQLVRMLPEGRVQAAIVAQELGMSPRSFTRRLADEHTSFSEILDNLRRQQALRHLADERVSLQQIAWLLGYSEMAAFNHAFKRWTGTSPSRARQRPAIEAAL
jgi:AraC-like DNA-binding protein